MNKMRWVVVFWIDVTVSLSRLKPGSLPVRYTAQRLTQLTITHPCKDIFLRSPILCFQLGRGRTSLFINWALNSYYIYMVGWMEESKCASCILLLISMDTIYACKTLEQIQWLKRVITKWSIQDGMSQQCSFVNIPNPSTVNLQNLYMCMHIIIKDPMHKGKNVLKCTKIFQSGIYVFIMVSMVYLSKITKKRMAWWYTHGCLKIARTNLYHKYVKYVVFHRKKCIKRTFSNCSVRSAKDATGY